MHFLIKTQHTTAVSAWELDVVKTHGLICVQIYFWWGFFHEHTQHVCSLRKTLCDNSSFLSKYILDSVFEIINFYLNNKDTLHITGHITGHIPCRMTLNFSESFFLIGRIYSWKKNSTKKNINYIDYLQYTQVILLDNKQFKHNSLFINSFVPPIPLGSMVMAKDRCITYKK